VWQKTDIALLLLATAVLACGLKALLMQCCCARRQRMNEPMRFDLAWKEEFTAAGPWRTAQVEDQQRSERHRFKISSDYHNDAHHAL
jgi:hypothetical protein